MTAKKTSHNHYGMPVYETSEGEFAIGTEAQANKAAREYILDSLWAFNSSFIGKFAKLSASETKTIKTMQREMSEGANPLIRRIIGEKNLDYFVREAIRADGRGHFLSPYDGREETSDRIDDTGLPKGRLAYRIN